MTLRPAHKSVRLGLQPPGIDRHDSKNTPKVKLNKGYAAVSFLFSEQQSGDQKPDITKKYGRRPSLFSH